MGSNPDADLIGVDTRSSTSPCQYTLMLSSDGLVPFTVNYVFMWGSIWNIIL
jgi:hypothetical protein